MKIHLNLREKKEKRFGLAPTELELKKMQMPCVFCYVDKIQ